ncbi:MAG: M15 family metallopeptidase [Solirubrobacteraceae bacterium]|nr:M15 family metallopeptidase [Solirubrobacteraceae bacterium]
MAWPAGAAASPGDPVRAGGTTVQTVEGLPPFKATIEPLTAAEREAMTPSVWRKGCPVGLRDLRAVRAKHVGFDGRAHDGILVVHRARAASVRNVLRGLYAAGFPIRRMHPIQRYGGDDSTSIDDDNTSAFNCRAVTGGTGWSEHAYGRAIDLNPIENPYVTGAGSTEHAASKPVLDRSDVRPGMATEGSLVVRAFGSRGWKWGGRWTAPIDHQHFSTTGR